ncbi:MAG TPA: FAD-dependent oxidoreductase, partial [Microthrixaceae bacterium]|nr:FAD-dependent oxidoreductase [Microthrixaceae bacterium]
MSLRFVIIGGGPAGTQAATSAARLGADVTLIERDIVGGAAHLWDCVPSKAMIATGGRLDTIEDSSGMGLRVTDASVDLEAVRERIARITDRLEHHNRTLLESQGVEIVRGTGRLLDGHTVVATTE